MQRSTASRHSQEKNIHSSSTGRQLRAQRTTTSQRTAQSSTHSGSAHPKGIEKPSRPRVSQISWLFIFSDQSQYYFNRLSMKIIAMWRLNQCLRLKRSQEQDLAVPFLRVLLVPWQWVQFFNWTSLLFKYNYNFGLFIKPTEASMSASVMNTNAILTAAQSFSAFPERFDKIV